MFCLGLKKPGGPLVWEACSNTVIFYGFDPVGFITIFHHHVGRIFWDVFSNHLKQIQHYFLEPQTTIYKQMFGETTISYVKIGNHPVETTIYKWLALGFQVEFGHVSAIFQA